MRHCAQRGAERAEVRTPGQVAERAGVRGKRGECRCVVRAQCTHCLGVGGEFRKRFCIALHRGSLPFFAADANALKLFAYLENAAAFAAIAEKA